MEGVESSREQKQQLAPFQLSPAAAAAAATTTTAAADSSDVEKKIKDNFVKEMSKVIVKIFSLESDSNLIYYHTFDEQIFAQFASMNYSKP